MKEGRRGWIRRLADKTRCCELVIFSSFDDRQTSFISINSLSAAPSAYPISSSSSATWEDTRESHVINQSLFFVASYSALRPNHLRGNLTNIQTSDRVICHEFLLHLKRFLQKKKKKRAFTLVEKRSLWESSLTVTDVLLWKSSYEWCNSKICHHHMILMWRLRMVQLWWRVVSVSRWK